MTGVSKPRRVEGAGAVIGSVHGRGELAAAEIGELGRRRMCGFMNAVHKAMHARRRKNQRVYFDDLVELFRQSGCRKRDLNEPAGWIADGALGFWAAIDAQSPKSAQQRCTNHKTMNVIDKLPQAEQAEAVKRVRATWRRTARPRRGSWRRS